MAKKRSKKNKGRYVRISKNARLKKGDVVVRTLHVKKGMRVTDIAIRGVKK